MGSTEIQVLGLFPISLVSECEHSIRVSPYYFFIYSKARFHRTDSPVLIMRVLSLQTWYSVGYPLSSLPAILEGVTCSYTLGSDFFTISHSFGVPLPSPFAPLKRSLLLIPEMPRKMFQLFSEVNSTASRTRVHQDGSHVLLPPS